MFALLLVISHNRILEHDDSLTDRSDGGILDKNFRATKSLWLDVYHKEYKVPGGMYRGEPPKEFFDQKWVSNDKCKQERPISQDSAFLIAGVHVPLSHLIGEVGASSVGRDENSKLMWMSIDSPEAFIRPAPKSTVKNVNANPRKPMYVFGAGGMYTCKEISVVLHHDDNFMDQYSDISFLIHDMIKIEKGTGYYHLHTREAYGVILRRLEGKKSSVECERCLGIFCCLTIVGALCGIPLSIGAKKKLKDVESLIALTKLRKNAAGPSSEIDIPPELLEHIRKNSKKPNRTGDGHNDAGYGGVYYYGGSDYYAGEVVTDGGAAACG